MSVHQLAIGGCAIGRMICDVGPILKVVPTEEMADFACVVCVERGKLLMRRDEKDVVVASDQVVMMIAREQNLFTMLENETTFICLGLPMERIEPLVGNVEAFLQRYLPDKAAAAVQLAYTYGATLLNTMPEKSGDYEGVLASHIADILTNVFDERSGHQPGTYRGHISHRRKEEIYADIQAHLLDPDLNSEKVAARIGLKPRRVRDLVAEDGMSFVSRVRYLRLQYAAMLIDDPAKIGLTMLEIAQAAGFADLSYFYRTFRSQFGVPPSQYRKRSLRTISQNLS